MLQALHQHQIHAPRGRVEQTASAVFASAALRVVLMVSTLCSIFRTSITRIVSRAATATTTIRPRMLAVIQSDS